MASDELADSKFKGWDFKRLRRFAIAIAILCPLLYFIPYITVFFLACGLIDISRHFRITPELVQKYFLGNGILTWLLSPINLLADLLSARNLGLYRLEDLPQSHREEIQACVQAFVENGDLIKARVGEVL